MEAETNSPEDASAMAIDQPKTVTKVGAENEEWGDHQSEASSMESVITKHINDEGKVRSDSRTKSSYDADELEKILESQLVESSEIMKDSKITPEKVTNIKESNKDKALQTLPNTATVRVVTVHESMQEEINTEAELTVTDTKEGQIPENNFEEKVKFLKAFGLLEVTHQISVENELKAAFQSETQNREITFINHLNLEGETTEITLTNDTEEQEKVTVSCSAEKLEINNNGNFIQERAKEMEEENEMQLQKTASESGVPEDRTLQTLAYVGAEAFDKSIQEEILNKELEVTTTKEGQIPENFEQKMKVPKAFGLNQVTHQTSAENVLPAETQFEVQNQENTIIKHPNLEEETTKVNPTNDTEEQEKVQASHTGEQLENEDDGKFKQEKAKETEEATKMQLLKTPTESPPEDKVHSTMPTSAMVKGDTEKIIKQQTLHNYEIAVIYTDRSCREENKLEENGKFDQEEAKGIEEATKTQLLNTATETTSHMNNDGLPEEEVQQKLPTPAIDQGGTVQILQQQIFHDDESESINNAKSFTPDNELHRMSTVVEEPDQPDTKDNIGIVKDQQADQQATSTQGVITNYITGVLTSESSTKVSDDVDEQKTEESHGVENLETDASKIPADKATDAKQLTDVDIQNTETKGVPEDKAPQTLHKAASVENEAVDESSKEEIQQDELQSPQYEFNAKRDTPEEETCQLSVANEQKSESQPAVPNEETTFVKHPDGETTNDTEEQEEDQASHAKENLLIKDDEKVDQEEAKEIKEATKTQLINTEAESRAEEEDQPKLLTPANVQHDTDEIIQQQTLRDDESEGIDTAKTCVPKNKVEGNSNIVEEPDQPETKDNNAIVKEEQADHQSKGSSIQNVITNDITEEGILTSESTTKLCDDVDEKNTEESHGVENFEIKDASKISENEAADAKQFTDAEIQNSEIEGVPKDKALQALQNATSFENEAVDESSQEEIQQEEELQTPQSEFDAKRDIPEEETCQLSVANEQKSESQPTVPNEETTFVKHPDGETAEINPTNDTEEQEEIQASHDKENLLIGDVEKFNLEEAKGIDEPTNTQILNTEPESPAEEELQPKLPTPIIVQRDTDEIILEQTFHDDESEGIDKARTCIAENKLEGMSTVVKEPDQPETKANGGIVIEEQADHQSEGSSTQSVITTYITEEGILKSESSTKLSDDVDEQQTEELHGVEYFKNSDASIISADEAADAKKFIDVKIQNSKTEDPAEEEVQPKLSTPATIQRDPDEIIKQQTLHGDESKGIDKAKTCIAENKLEAMSIVVEDPDQPETKDNDGIVKEEQADHQSEGSHMQSDITNYIIDKGILTSESSTKLSDDEDEQKTEESHGVENFENKNACKISPDKAADAKQFTDLEIQNSEPEGVPDDKAPKTLHNTASVENEAVDESSQEKIQQQEEIQTPQSEFNAKRDIPEEDTCQLSMANKQKSESQPAVQNEETKFVKHPYSDGETAEINPTNDTEEQEEIQASHTKENLLIEDDEKVDQDEATKTQLLNTEAESPAEEEVQPKLPIPAKVQRDTDEIIQQETLHHDESEGIDMAKTCIPENKLEGNSNIVEEPDQLETKDNNGIVKEEQADHQSEGSSIQNVITNYITEKEILTSESTAKLSDDVDEEKTEESHKVENFKNRDASKISADKAADARQFTDAEIQNSETEGVPEDKAPQTLMNAALVEYEAVDESSKDEIQQEAEEETCQINAENEKKSESEHAVQNEETTFEKHPCPDGETAEINPTNDTEEQEEDQVCRAKENLHIEDGEKVDQDEAKGIEETSKTQLLNPEAKKEEIQPKLPTVAIIQRDTAEIIQQETLHDDESEGIDKAKTCVPENKLEGNSNIVEEPDQPETKDNHGIVKEEQADHQSEGSSIQNFMTNYTTEKGILTSESTAKLSDDVDEKKTEESHRVENSENRDASKISAEEAANAKKFTDAEIQNSETEGVPEVKAPQTLHSAELLEKETVDESSQEEIQQVEELQTPQPEFNAKRDITEEETCQLSVANKQKSESQPAVQNEETTFVKDPYSDGETAEINPTNDTEEEEETQVSHTKENLLIEDGETVDEEEAEGIDEVTKMQLLNPEAESPAEEELQPKLATPAIVQRDTDEIIQQETIHDNESEGTDKAKTCIAENKLEGMSTIVEDPHHSETTDNVGIVKEEQADHQSEGSSMQSVNTNYITEEGILTSESTTKLIDDVDEQKTEESHGAENFENRDASKISTDAKQFTDVEVQNSETEAVPEDKAPQTLHNAASIKNDAVDESSQEEIQKGEDVQTPQYEFDAKRDIPEEETSQLSAENEQKSESQPAVQNKETAFVNHLYSDWETAEINPTNDMEEQEKIQARHAKENILIDDGETVDQEEAKGIDEATTQLLNTEAESPAEEEVQPKLPIPAIVQCDTDDIIQQQTRHEDESKGINKPKTHIAENKFEGKSTVVEEPDQPETKDNHGIVKEKQADHHTEGSSTQSVITNYITEEGILTSESTTKLSDDVDEQKKEESHRVENFENRDASQISADEAADAKQFTDAEIQNSETEGVPEDKAQQTLHNAASVKNEAVDECSQEEIQQEELQTPQSEFDAKRDIPEEETCQLSVANEQKSESQPAVPNEETTFVKHPDGETAEINPTNNTEEQEEIQASHTKETSLIEDGEKVNQDEAKGIDVATKTQLLNTEAESPAEEEVQPKLPTPAIDQRDTDEIIQQETLQEDESEGIDKAKTCIAENKLEGMSSVVEEPYQTETKDNYGIVKEEQQNHQSEGSRMQSVITNYITEEGILTSESTRKFSDDVDEQKTEESQRVENFENRDASKISADESAHAKQFTDVEIQKSETEGVPEDKAPQTLHNIASVKNEAVDESSQEKIQQQEVQASRAKENLLIEDGEKADQEEAKGIEEATKPQLLNTEAESPAEEEVQPKLPTPAIVQRDTDEIIQQETFHDESKGIDKAKTCIAENKLEGMSTVVEEPDQTETKDNNGIVKEEQAYHQSEGSRMQSVITNYITEGGILTSESTTKFSDDVDEQKTEESHEVENFENRDASKISADKAADAKQFTDVEIPKSETEGVPEDKAPQTLHNVASVENEAVDESSQEKIQQEEVQTPQYEFNAKSDIPEEETCQLSVANKQKSESQPAVQNDETTFVKHPYSDGETAEINPTNDSEEQEEIQASHTKENLLIEDSEKVDQDEAKGIDEATKTQLLNTEAESPAEEVQPKLPIPAKVQRDTDEIIQQQTLHSDDSEGIDTSKTCIAENKLEEMFTIVEEPDQPETKDNDGIVKEEQADHQSKGSSIQNVITNYITAEGFVTSKSSNKLNYDVDEQKMVDSRSGDNLESKYASKITADEATDAKQLTDEKKQNSEIEGVPEDKSLQTLPNAALVGSEGVDESSHEEIQPEEEFAATYAKDVQTPQYEFDAKKDFPEEETCQLIAENEQKLESQPALQNEETTFINHPYLDGETAEINPTNDTEEQGKVPATHAMKKLVIKDDGKFDQEEAKEIEAVTKTQLLSTATESPAEEEVQPKFPTPAIVQGDTKQILQQQTLHDDESEAIDNANSCIPENELERMSIVAEDPDQLEAMANIGTVKEEEADHQSEAPSMQSAITNYINAEGLVTTESITKLSYDVDEQKTVNSHSIKNLESKDASKITTEEATDTKQLTDVEIQKSENESVPGDKALQTLPSTASVSIEKVNKSIQERHTEAELAVIDTKERQISENYSEAKKEVSENMLKKAFDLHKVTCQTSTENEQRAELLSEQQSPETTVTKHINLEGETTEINPTNETEEHEKVPTSQTREKLEINDDGNFIQEEEKEMEKATERQLLKTAKESVSEDEAQTTLPPSTIVKCETVERIVEEQKLEEEESAAMENNNSGRPENELEQMAKVVETIDQHETMAKVLAENEEHANHQYEQSSMENVITKHINSEGTVTTENSTKSSYDVEELEKVQDSHSTDNSEIKDGGKTMPEEASKKKEATGLELQKPEIESVPEDKTISTLSTILSVRVEIVEESGKEEIKKEAEPAVTATKEGQRPENDFVRNLEVLEAFDLHKGPVNTCVENEKKAEVQSEAKSQETMIIKHPNLEGQETAEISPSNDTKEHEKKHEVAKPRGVSESVSANITEQTDRGKLETQEAETTQLGSTKEDEGGDEFEKISPSSVTVISTGSQDNDMKVLHKKSHGILSGVGSKVKHSISKVKKAITGKSSHQKTPSPKENK